jgi:chaperonin GroEL
LKKPEQIDPHYGVTFQPQTYQGMLHGVDKLANAIRPTLGPLPRRVAIGSSDPGKAPELMDDGGLIARRMIQLPDRDEDVGAMYLRHVLWRMREDFGDGTATTAVLFQDILHRGVRHIVDGGHAMPLRAGLEKGARLVLAELDRMSRPPGDCAGDIVKTLCFDEPMAAVFSEIFDTIGEYGHLEFRTSQSRELNFEYTQGSYWEGPLHSQVMINRPLEDKAVLDNAGVLVTDLAITDPHHLVRAIVEARKAGKTSLVLICNTINEACIGFLMAESTHKAMPVIAVKTPHSRIDEQMAAMEDIAILTGAQSLTLHAGETLENVGPQHYGQARSVWANKQFLGIWGGQGDPRKIREHAARLKRQYARMEAGDARSLIQTRIGKIQGGGATLFVGGATEAEIAARKDMAERSAETIRGALSAGLLPGGGAAFLACKPALKTALETAADPDEAAAYSILLKAMDVPLRSIAANAGLDPAEVMAEIKHAGPGFGYDVRKQRTFPLDRAEILDTASVVQGAARRAITGAAQLLTVDVLVHLKKMETVTDT